jgi:hypothetical protein
MLDDTLEFDTAVIRRLVETDPFLAFTVIRHNGEAEQHWLQQVFTLEVCKDPVLRSRYRTLASTT